MHRTSLRSPLTVYGIPRATENRRLSVRDTFDAAVDGSFGGGHSRILSFVSHNASRVMLGLQFTLYLRVHKDGFFIISHPQLNSSKFCEAVLQVILAQDPMPE